MTDMTEDQKTSVRQPYMRPYNTPRLFVYGAVRELTANGRSGQTENMGKDFQPNKRA